VLGFSCILRPLILGTLFSGQVHGELILPSAAILEYRLATSHSCYTKYNVRALVCCCNIIIGILFVFLAEMPILFCHGTSDLQDVLHLRYIFNRPSMMRSVISLSDLSHLLRISLLPWWKFINGPFIIKENCEALVCVIISRIFQLALKVLWYLIKLVFISNQGFVLFHMQISCGIMLPLHHACIILFSFLWFQDSNT
jgi:hypothetical protein